MAQQMTQLEITLHNQAMGTVDKMQSDVLQSLNNTLRKVEAQLASYQGKAAVAQQEVGLITQRTGTKFSQYHVRLVDTMNKIGQSFVASVDEGTRNTNTSIGTMDQVGSSVNALPGLS